MKLIVTKILLILICFFSCKKKVVDENEYFIGSWTCYKFYSDFTVTIEIDNNNNGYYIEKRANGDNAGFNGITRSSTNNLKIGRFYHFNIIDPPHKIDTTTSNVYIYNYNENTNNWSMTLSEVKPALYLKGNMTYYKAEY